MAPMAVDNDRLAADGGAVMVEDVDDEVESNNKDEDKPATAAQFPPPLPTVSLPIVAAMVPRQGS